MGVLQFFWHCMRTTLQGLIGLALIMLLLWVVVKIFRPTAQFPKPVIYRRRSMVKKGEER